MKHSFTDQNQKSIITGFTFLQLILADAFSSVEKNITKTIYLQYDNKTLTKLEILYLLVLKMPSHPTTEINIGNLPCILHAKGYFHFMLICFF